MSRLICLPTELICQITFYIEDYNDLLNFALTTRLLHDIVSPYIEYHSISCCLDDPRKCEDVWEHLSSSSLLTSSKKLIANLSLVESSSRSSRGSESESGIVRGRPKIFRVPKACKPTRSRDVEYSSTKPVQNACNAIRQMSNLVSFEVCFSRHTYLDPIFEALAAAEPVLKRIGIGYIGSGVEQLPMFLLLDLDYTHLTHLTIRSKISVQDTALLTILTSRTPKLTNLTLHLPFDISAALKDSTWPNLRHFEIGHQVRLFCRNPNTGPHALGSADSGTGSDKRAIFTSFLRRHPCLEYLYLPVWTQLASCFPTEEGLCPNVRVLQTSPEMSESRLNSINPLHIPTSLSHQLTHFSARFHPNVVQAFTNMPNLDSCNLAMDMDQVEYLETLLRSTPKITKLRIELLGTGMKLLPRLEKTVKVLLSLSPPLTHLFSLFDSLDMGQHIGKDFIHRLATKIPTLKYTTGYMEGNCYILRINRGGTTTYMPSKTTVVKGLTRLPSPHEDIVDLDNHLTNWGSFWR